MSYNSGLTAIIAGLHAPVKIHFASLNVGQVLGRLTVCPRPLTIGVHGVKTSEVCQTSLAYILVRGNGTMLRRVLGTLCLVTCLAGLLGACLFNIGQPTAEPTATATLPPAPTTRPTFTPIPPTPTRTPTLTPTPAPKATATPAAPSVSVTADLLNVRETPSTDAKILARLTKGTVLPVVGRNVAADWLLVKLSDGRQGWVALQWVESSVPPTTLPINESAAPAPTRIPPTSTVSTTATATAQRPLLPAPLLLAPDSGQSFGARGPLQFSWSSERALAEDEYFVITIAYPHQGTTWNDVHWVKERSFVPPAYLAGLITGDRRCQWWVVVMRQTGKGADELPVGVAVSLPSEKRSLVWGD